MGLLPLPSQPGQMLHAAPVHTVCLQGDRIYWESLHSVLTSYGWGYSQACCCCTSRESSPLGACKSAAETRVEGSKLVGMGGRWGAGQAFHMLLATGPRRSS